MSIDIYRNFELIDRIYSFERLEVSKLWCGVGRFSLTMRENPNLQTDDLLLVGEHALIVEDIYTYRDLKGTAKYNIKGCNLNGLLNRRVLVAKYTAPLNANIEAEIRSMLQRAFVDPGVRKIDNFVLADALGVAQKVLVQKDYENMRLSQVIGEMLDGTQLGYRVEFNSKTKQFTCGLVQGADRSGEVVFSERYRNLAYAEMNSIGSVEINAAYNKDGVIGDAQGLNRREGYAEKHVPARLDILGKILPTEQYIYGEDWKLGDFVTVEDSSIRLKAKKQILEIREYFGRNYDMEVSFGGE